MSAGPIPAGGPTVAVASRTDLGGGTTHAHAAAIGGPAGSGAGLPVPTTPTAVTPSGGPGAPPAAAPAATTPAAQLAAPLLRLSPDSDGVHRLTIHLHPADLGPVRVVAEIRDGDIHIHLAGATDAGREALRDALPDLRRDLEQAGFGTTSLDLRQPAPGRDQTGRHGADGGSDPSYPQPAAPTRASPPESVPVRPPTLAGRLDLHV